MPDSRTYYVIADDNCKFESMTKEQILAAITQAVESHSIADVDTGFVTTLKEMNAGNGLKIWVGTSAQYNALDPKEENCLYILTDDTELEDLETEIQRLDMAVSGATAQIETLSDEYENLNTKTTNFFNNVFINDGCLKDQVDHTELLLGNTIQDLYNVKNRTAALETTTETLSTEVGNLKVETRTHDVRLDTVDRDISYINFDLDKKGVEILSVEVTYGINKDVVLSTGDYAISDFSVVKVDGVVCSVFVDPNLIAPENVRICGTGNNNNGLTIIGGMSLKNINLVCNSTTNKLTRNLSATADVYMSSAEQGLSLKDTFSAIATSENFSVYDVARYYGTYINEGKSPAITAIENDYGYSQSDAKDTLKKIANKNTLSFAYVFLYASTMLNNITPYDAARYFGWYVKYGENEAISRIQTETGCSYIEATNIIYYLKESDEQVDDKKLSASPASIYKIVGIA